MNCCITEELQDRTLLSAAVSEKIREMIIQQHLKPGAKLPSEAQLAQRFHVSRPTLREAMKILKARNIVVIRQGDGTYISDNTGMGEDPLGLRFIEKEALTEGIFEARLLIEPQIAMLAAQRATMEEIQELEHITQRMKEIDYKNSARSLLDIQFHTCIAKSSRNAVFNQIMPVIYETIEKGVVILLESEASHRRAQHMHRDIYEAIARRDAVAAQSAMTVHIYSSIDDIKREERMEL